jgi:hypothetical protein
MPSGSNHAMILWRTQQSFFTESDQCNQCHQCHQWYGFLAFPMTAMSAMARDVGDF